jgi:hypothetical protein
MALEKSNFQIIALQIPIDSSAKIDSIRVELVAENVDMEGALYITDVMLQGGTVATSHALTGSEIRWSFENA